MLISVVIPFHEYTALLDRMLLSVIGQLSEQVELIVVGDGTDETTVATIQKKHSGLSVYTIPKSGANAARQHGIDQSSGTYIVLADSDDLFPPQALSIYQNIIAEKQPDLIIGNVDRYIESVKQGPFYKFPTTEIILTKEQLSNQQLYSFPIFIFCKCFKKTLLENTTLVNSSMYQDFSISSILFKQATSLYFTNKITYKYFTRKGSVSSDESNTLNNLRAALPSVEAVLSHYNKDVLSIPEKKYLKLAIVRFYFGITRRSLSLRNVKFSNELRTALRKKLSMNDIAALITVPKAFIMGLILYNNLLFKLYYRIYYSIEKLNAN